MLKKAKVAIIMSGFDLPWRRGRPGYSPSRDGVGGGVDDQEAEDSVKPRRAHIPPAAFYTRRQPL